MDVLGDDHIFDLTNDSVVDQEDHRFWVEQLAMTYHGDANLDREFNSHDMVQVFQAGQYEDGVDLNSSWATGDWNGDREFDSGDLVLAFQSGGYEQGVRPAVLVVPEPTGSLLLWAVGLALVHFREAAWPQNRRAVRS